MSTPFPHTPSTPAVLPGQAVPFACGARIFVVGGNGFIGSRVVRALVQTGYRPRLLLRPTSRTDRIADLPFEGVTGDIRDADSVVRGAAGCAATIHLASPSSWDVIDSPEMEDIVLGGTRNVLEAARACGPSHRVVFVSSCVAINGTDKPVVHDEQSPFTLDDRKLSYCRHKRAAEKLCRDSGVPVVITNPAEVYGPEDKELVTAGNLVDFANNAPALVCEGGTSVVHVDDVALGIVRALERGRSGERYILGGENLTIRQLAELTLSILGKKIKVLQVPNALIRGIASAANLARVRVPFNPKVIPYATRYWFVSAKKAETELAMTFRSARATLEPTLAWLRQTGHIP